MLVRLAQVVGKLTCLKPRYVAWIDSILTMQKGVGIEPSASKSASEVALLCRKLLTKLCQRFKLMNLNFSPRRKSWGKLTKQKS